MFLILFFFLECAAKACKFAEEHECCCGGKKCSCADLCSSLKEIQLDEEFDKIQVLPRVLWLDVHNVADKMSDQELDELKAWADNSGVTLLFLSKVRSIKSYQCNAEFYRLKKYGDVLVTTEFNKPQIVRFFSDKYGARSVLVDDKAVNAVFVKDGQNPKDVETMLKGKGLPHMSSNASAKLGEYVKGYEVLPYYLHVNVGLAKKSGGLKSSQIVTAFEALFN